jgi:hypothetical protein
MRAITTKYLGPTNTRGARVKVSDPGYASRSDGTRARSMIISWDHALDGSGNFAAAARVALARWEWSGTWVGGGLDTCDTFVCCSPRGPLTVYEDAFSIPVPPDEMLAALRDLARWATSGDRTGNPYAKPEIKDALKVIARARGKAQEEWMEANADE